MPSFNFPYLPASSGTLDLVAVALVALATLFLDIFTDSYLLAVLKLEAGGQAGADQVHQVESNLS